MAAAVCEWPASGKPDLEWVQSLAEAMLAASQARGGGSLCKTRGLAARVPYATAEALLSEAASALAKDATVVDVEGYDVDEVIVVGDTHGQFHDVLRLIELSGPPGAGFAGADARECASARLAADSTQRMRVEGAYAGEAAVPAANAVDTEAAVAADMDATSDSSSDDEVTINPRRRANPQQQERHAGGGEKEQDQLGADEGQASAAPIPVRKKTRTIVFNGDFVDRGAWSVETLLLLCAYRLAAPGRAVLLRGNHESKFCTMCYGFNTELEAKYGSDAKALYRRCLRVFSNLPLAALVAGKALVLHGGLFRAPPKKSKKAGGKGGRSKRHYAVQLGTVDELRRASRGGQDPDGEGVRAVASDVLWSDPTMDEGLEENDNRGIGLLYGPDATKQFLKENDLKLVLRSHEGPDARADRVEDGMKPMDAGFTVDHDCGEVGKLCTVFSAPSYPQFLSPGEERIHNQAAFVRLTAGTDFSEPSPFSFDAAERPAASCYYDLVDDAETEAGDLEDSDLDSDYK